MDLTFETVTKQQTYLEEVRKDYEKTKRLCVDLTYPERVASWEWLEATTGSGVKGKKYGGVYKRVHDGTAKYAYSVWLNGVMGNFFPKQLNWFKENFSERNFKDSKIVLKWMQENDEHLTDVLNSSGSVGCDNDYYNQKRWVLGDCGCIGDSFLFIQKDKQTGKQFFMAAHPKDCWIKRDFWGRIEVIHYKMGYTLGQMVREFGKDSLGENQKIIYDTESGPDRAVTIIYGCYKNYDYNPDGVGWKDMPWQTVWVNVEGQKKILQSGDYTLNPVPYSMRRPPDWSYGQGLVYSNILECLTVDELGKDLLMGVQQAVNPAMLISSALMNKLNLKPGAVNKVDHKSSQGVKMGDMLARIIDSSGYPFGAEHQALWIDLINRRFGVPLFVALSSGNASGKTAFEVNQIKAEQAVLLGPMISEVSSQTDMEFDRIYQLELDNGDAPDVPQEIMDAKKGRIDLSYIGPLNQLLKQYYESGSLLNTIAYIQQALAVAPDSGVIVEGDELMRRIMRSGNCPEDVIRSDRDVTDLRAIDAQLREQERQANLAATAAKATSNFSKPIQENSLLQKIGEAA